MEFYFGKSVGTLPLTLGLVVIPANLLANGWVHKGFGATSQVGGAGLGWPIARLDGLLAYQVDCVEVLSISAESEAQWSL